MAAQESFDDLVIGTGQAGKPLARALAGAGRRMALLERGPVGGTCVNVGCTPTKTMVASARIAHLARHADAWGIRTGDVEVDMGRVRQRKRDVVESFRGGSRKGVEETDGIELVFGDARLTGPRTVAVTDDDGPDRKLTAERVFLNVGARPRRPPIDGLDDVDWLDNAGIMELDRVPGHLVVVGGGYIGVEFGQMFRRLGAEVTIVQRGPQLLAREDADVAEAVAAILEEDGIEVLLDASARRVRPDEEGVLVTVDTGRDERRLPASHLLVATGRRPNTDGLGLDAAGVETDERGFVRVDGELRTSADGIWALGDVTGGPAFTHVAYDDYRIVERNLLGDGGATTADRLVPYTVFIDPELGRVGLSEAGAREAGQRVRVAKLPMTRVARAIERGETRGFMKAVVDADTDAILGCAILGIEGGEVMSVLQTAMLGELPYTALRDGIFAHPTLAESLNNLFMTLDD